MIAPNTLSRLPPGAALLVLAAILSPTSAHALPQQTKTIEHRELQVRSFPFVEPPAPTDATDINALFARQVNTICGYVDGNPDLPATCSAGSHCVVEADQGYIGCCPDSGPCTEGIYTGCVDGNSDPQTEINPYVYTCSGGDVCYQNEFEGGFSQYGCGSDSALAATVAGSASDRQSLDIPTLSLEWTAEVTSLSEPTTLGTRTSRSSESTTSASTTSTSSGSSSSSSSSSTRTRTSESPSATAGSEEDNSGGDAPQEDSNDTPVGAIVGGSIGAAAFAAIVGLVALYLIRRRKGNVRQGPGQNEPEQYISPVSQYRNNFAPLPTIQDVEESQSPQTIPPTHGAVGSQRSREMDTISEENLLPSNPSRAVSPLRDPSSDGYRYPSSDLGGGDAVMGGRGARMEPDRTPLISPDEVVISPADNFAQGFDAAVNDRLGDGNALQSVPEPPPPPFTRSDSGSHEYMSEYPGQRSRGGSALWQQNRRSDWV